MFFLWPTGVHFADLRKRKHGTLAAVLSTFYSKKLGAEKAEIIMKCSHTGGLCYAPEKLPVSYLTSKASLAGHFGRWFHRASMAGLCDL